MKDNIKLFSLMIGNKDTEVFKTYHVLKPRHNGTKSRDHNILKNDYRDILKIAIREGLSSFRNKGNVVISFSDMEIK